MDRTRTSRPFDDNADTLHRRSQKFRENTVPLARVLEERR